jgi:hypothetical protein
VPEWAIYDGSLLDGETVSGKFRERGMHVRPLRPALSIIALKAPKKIRRLPRCENATSKTNGIVAAP